MKLPLTKTAKAGAAKEAGLLGGAIGIMSHPVAGAAATVSQAVPAMAAENRRLNEEKAQAAAPKIAYLLPKLAFLAALAPLAARAGAFLAKPAVQAAGNALTIAPAAMSMMGSKAPPIRPPKANAGGAAAGADNGAFAPPMTRLASVITTPETGSVDMAGQVAPLGGVPGTRGNASMTAPRDGMSQGAQPTTSSGSSMPKAPSTKPGAMHAFKVSNLTATPKLDTFLNRGSQAAVIGTAAIPFYQLWQERKKSRDGNAQKVSAMLPLQPRRGILHRIGDGVKDFGEGAYDALDNEAEKALAPSKTLDPASTRLPALSHII